MVLKKSLINTKQEEEDKKTPQTSAAEESEYEEEVMVIELNGLLDAESVRQAVRNGLITVRRANGSDPLVQIGSAMYTGQWAQTLGTDLIFCASDKVVYEGNNHLSTAPPFVTTNEDIGFGPFPSCLPDNGLELVAVAQTRLVAQKAVFSSTADTIARPSATVEHPDLTEAVEEMINVENSRKTPKKRQKSKN